ncbi:hypothetical protein SLEP1_g52361 [Rubroshorea leprosula]|uniref:Uncharacterized protein n=1 Tax=Rubroshorea leprosula TaxID=152421 RepID=A0AAV5M9R6_9ROSI|nr:hypothetical protein SLEP1_g52361 [Rubroshorea leprosula]
MADLVFDPLVDVKISKVISVTTKQLNLAGTQEFPYDAENAEGRAARC